MRCTFRKIEICVVNKSNFLFQLWPSQNALTVAVRMIVGGDLSRVNPHQDHFIICLVLAYMDQ